jgi:hypothetical protein
MNEMGISTFGIPLARLVAGKIIKVCTCTILRLINHQVFRYTLDYPTTI